MAEVNARIRDVVADLARLSGGAARADADAGATPAMDPEEVRGGEWVCIYMCIFNMVISW